MAQFNANIDVGVKVDSSQVTALEKKLAKLSKFELGGGTNKEFLDVQNALAYNRAIDQTLVKLEKIAKLNRLEQQYTRRLGPQRGGTQYGGPIGPGQASPSRLSSSLAQRRNERIQQGLRQYPTTIGPQPDFLARNKALKQQAKLLRVIEDKTAKIDSQKAKRLAKQNSLTNGLLKLKQTELTVGKQLQKISLEKARDKAEELADQRILNKELKKSQQYSKPIGPKQAPGAKGGARRRGGGGGAGGGLAAGIGFPLLFGGGPGSVLGGALGSAGGFGPQILASAIGGIIDSAVANIAKLGQALNPLTADIDAVVEAAGESGTAFGKLIKDLEKVAGKEAALAAATAQLSTIIGTEGVAALKDFGDASTDLANELSKALTSLGAVLAPILADITRAATSSLERSRLLRRGSNDLKDDPAIQKIRDDFSARKFGEIEAEDKIVAYVKELELKKQIATTEDIILKTNKKRAALLKKEEAILIAQNDVLKTGNSILDKGNYAAQKTVILAQKDLELAEAKVNTDKNSLQNIQNEIELKSKYALAALDIQKAEAETERIQERTLERIKAISMLENGRIDVAQKRMSMESSIASARSSALLAVNALETQRATNAGDTAKQLKLQVKRAKLIYNQTVLQVQEEQRKAKLTALTAQIKLKELQATVAVKQAKGEANALDFAAIELQKQALALTLEGVNAAAQIAQYNLQGANAIRQMTVEQAKFNAAASRAGGGGGGGATVYGGGTRSIGSATTEDLAAALSAAGVTGIFSEAQAGGILASKRQQERPGFAEGGYVTSPTNALIGEGGESEYVIPSSKMQESVRRYSAGARGSSVVSGGNDAAAGGSGGGASYSSENNAYVGGGSNQINVTTGPVIKMNGQNYVSMGDLQRGMSEAVSAAESNMSSRMRRSFSARRGMGL